MNELAIFSHEELMSLALLDLNNKQIQAALHKCKYLSSQNFASVSLYVCYGKIYLELYLEGLAEEYFRNALQLDPKQLDAKFELAILARNRGDLPEARIQLVEIVEMTPRNEEALFYLADLSFHMGLYQDAEKYFERVIDIAPRNSEYVYQASEYLVELTGLVTNSPAA